MGFASTYLLKRALFHEFLSETPRNDTGIIAVVPSYSEPHITQLLDSLYLCRKPDCSVEIIIVINAPVSAGFDEHLVNTRSIAEIGKWKDQHTDCFFRTYIIDATLFATDDWGVGSARKTGMDEAVRRFEKIGHPGGVIVCLDADCRVAPDYFTAITGGLLNRKSYSACSIYFEHPLNPEEYPEDVIQSIILYELHLRYYYQGLLFSGFPYAFHTVGSAVAVKALAYVRAGGMNRKKAGEDFYFIQKLIPAGGFFTLNQTTVFPSPRSSSRVPFGTGAAVAKLTLNNTRSLLTYNFKAFEDLKTFFSLTDRIFNCNIKELNEIYSSLPESIKLFLSSEEWILKCSEIISNTSGPESFKKRFFGWFNMFRIVKFMNNVHQQFYEKMPVEVSAYKILKETGHDCPHDEPSGLLRFYRLLEKDD